MLLVSCTQLEELTFVPRKQSLLVIDFSKYTEKGFFITPEKFLEEYESIGLITYEYLPEGEYKQSGSKPNPYYRPGENKVTSTVPVMMWVFKPVRIEQVMDSVYNICKKMGADALVNFKIEPKVEAYSSLVYKNPPIVGGYSISGFAIKRK